MRFSLLIAGVLATTVAAAPAPSSHVIHEKRNFLPSGWQKRAKLTSDLTLPIRIALAQQNLDRAYEFINEVSHPKSSKYGQHWSPAQIAKTFAPSDETVNEVKQWLDSVGISSDRVKMSNSLGWLKFNASVEEAEDLFKTEYFLYEHEDSGTKHVACEEYSVPESIRPHIDFVTPTVHFDRQLKPRKNNIRKREAPKKASGIDPSKAKNVGASDSPSLPKFIPANEILTNAKLHVDETQADLSGCDTEIFPECLRALYDIPLGTTAEAGNSYGIVEYTPQAFLQNDINLFFINFQPNITESLEPIIELIDGAIVQTIVEDSSFNGESGLDLQYSMSLISPQTITLYQVGDIEEGASFNNFLDAIDGSFCTFEGGDDPIQDAPYPDPVAGGFKGQDCGTVAPTNVISTSYGFNEADLTPAYEQRQCAEYMKLGLAGTTILYSSGDSGVAGNGGECIDPTTGQFNDGSSGMFAPSFPGGCPFVTSVGATQINPGSTVDDPESACAQVIFSGGGFSNVFDMPDYQADAVATWFTDFPTDYTSSQFNNSGLARGFPDVAANGANYVVVIDAEGFLVFGTSASSPVFGSVITLINEQRLAAGKSPVGFLNPTLYANPDVLTDITSGDNPGCGTNGFEAVPGWDPATGLGTPNFPAMLDLFLSLP